MELRHLRYFVAVAEEQNVTRAAARLHVSQPPLSRQIRDLEDELGVALFDHGAKAVRLTEAGRVFLTEARAVVQRADEAVQTGESRGERAARRNPRRLYAVADGGIALTWTKGAGRGVPQHLLFWAGNRHHALTLSPNEAERVSTSGRRRRTQLTK